ncbi:MAG: peptide deformylase [Candidatus Obscuribacterales bacterium]|nr:peptide deformylase [Candidatus Obscuribacterales bacterium]
MAVLPILTYPNALLKAVSEPVSVLDEQLLDFVEDLRETLYSHPGCVGIAAPQTGNLRRVIVIDAQRAKAGQDFNSGPLVMINPEINWQQGDVLAREGCLSLPHLTANVRRARNIRVSYMDSQGTQHSLETRDFEARVILHETDHLDGLLFLDRVSSLKTDVFRRKRY